jgi:chromate transport protein ChrA
MNSAYLVIVAYVCGVVGFVGGVIMMAIMRVSSKESRIEERMDWECKEYKK